TCFNLITGVYKPTSGQIVFNGRDITGTPANKIAHRGICRTFQNIRLFPALSVLENVVTAGFLRKQSTFVSALSYMPSAIQDTE
ncbi:ATP-binding cassette domain-containing protein, partial [Acinetobacter baumannii]